MFIEASKISPDYACVDRGADGVIDLFRDIASKKYRYNTINSKLNLSYENFIPVRI